MELEKTEVELPDSTRTIFREGWCNLTPDQLSVFVDFLLRHGDPRLLSSEAKAELSAKTPIANPSRVLESLNLTLAILNNAKENPLEALHDLLDDLKKLDLLTEDAAVVLQPCLATLIKDYHWVQPVESLLASLVPIYSGSSSRCVVVPQFELFGTFKDIDPEKYSPTLKALAPAVLLGLKSLTGDDKIRRTSYLLTDVDIDNLIKRLQIAQKQLLAIKANVSLTDSQ